MENHRAPTPDKRPIEIKNYSSVQDLVTNNIVVDYTNFLWLLALLFSVLSLYLCHHLNDIKTNNASRWIQVDIQTYGFVAASLRALQEHHGAVAAHRATRLPVRQLYRGAGSFQHPKPGDSLLDLDVRMTTPTALLQSSHLPSSRCRSHSV